MGVKQVGDIKCENWARAERGIDRIVKQNGECMVKVKYTDHLYPVTLTFYEEDTEEVDERMLR